MDEAIDHFPSHPVSPAYFALLRPLFSWAPAMHRPIEEYLPNPGQVLRPNLDWPLVLSYPYLFFRPADLPVWAPAISRDIRNRRLCQWQIAIDSKLEIHQRRQPMQSVFR